MWCWSRIEEIGRTDRVKNGALRIVTVERNSLYTVKNKKANWIGHILRKNCLFKHVFEGKIEESDGKKKQMAEAATG